MIAVVIVLLLLAAYYMYAKSHEEHGPAVFSKELVEKNAAIICNKDDPLNIPGGVFRVMSSNTIARYPNPDIANSWDLTWGSAIRVPCTGATALENMKLKP